jgi:hypothetical protein
MSYRLVTGDQVSEESAASVLWNKKTWRVVNLRDPYNVKFVDQRSIGC